MGEAPECTDGREGFYHPVVASGDAAACKLQLILRDFDTAALEERGRRLERMCVGLMARSPTSTWRSGSRSSTGTCTTC